MKRIPFYSVIISSLFTVAFFSMCNRKKKDPEPVIPETTRKIETKQTDQSGSGAADMAIDDVNDFINNKVGGGSNQHRVEAYNLPCGVVSVDSTTVGSVKRYTMKYGSKTRCGYKKKSGTVTFELINGTRFNDEGAKFRITFIDYVVEVEATGDIVKLNGFITSENISGGYVWESVKSGKTITHSIRGSFDVTYANGEVRNKKYFQRRTWSSDSGWAGLSYTATGDTLTNVSETGNTLDGNNYYEIQILTPWVWSNCGGTFAGPYILQKGKARMNPVIPNVSPVYFEVEAGYNTTNNNVGATPVEDCTSNTYKINTVYGPLNRTEYQLY